MARCFHTKSTATHVYRNLHCHRHPRLRAARSIAAARESLIKAQIRGGVDGIVPVGTTGESPTLNYEEHVHVIALAVKYAAGKIKVLAGTGGNSTSEAIYLTQHAEKVGADGSLQVAPYYNKPTQEGLVPAFPRRRPRHETAWHHALQYSGPLRG